MHSNELYHYGVLGMKWGVHRYTGSDGKTTAEGKQKYRTDRKLGAIGRAVTNTSMGQRLLGVGTNRGYREDRKEIKSAYKNLKAENKSISDKKARKEANKNLKSDYKKTKGEARETAARALYSWQSKSANHKIQTQHLGKQFVKGLALGGYGSLNYDRVRSNNGSKGKSFVTGFLSSVADNVTYGYASIADYAVNSMRQSSKNKKK